MAEYFLLPSLSFRSRSICPPLREGPKRLASTTVPQKDGHATATRALARVSAPAPPRSALPVKKGTILRATRDVQTYHPLRLKWSRLYGYGSGSLGARPEIRP